jgi:hypothetical protein
VLTLFLDEENAESLVSIELDWDLDLVFDETLIAVEEQGWFEVVILYLLFHDVTICTNL